MPAVEWGDPTIDDTPGLGPSAEAVPHAFVQGVELAL
jgi:hypothetical protein